jgi:hypothetical protein
MLINVGEPFQWTYLKNVKKNLGHGIICALYFESVTTFNNHHCDYIAITLQLYVYILKRL